MAKILKQNSNSHKGVELWAQSINDFGNFMFMFLSWKIMGDYFSVEGYIMPDNENFPLSLLHFCNLFCNQISHPQRGGYLRNTKKVDQMLLLRPLYFFALHRLEFCFNVFQKHFPRHIYKSWLTLSQLPPMRTWRPFCIQKSAKKLLTTECLKNLCAWGQSMHADQFGQFCAGSSPFVSSFARLYHKS